MAGNNGFHVEDIASILDGKQAIIDAQPPARRTPAAKIAHAIGQRAIAATHAELMKEVLAQLIALAYDETDDGRFWNLGADGRITGFNMPWTEAGYKQWNVRRTHARILQHAMTRRPGPFVFSQQDTSWYVDLANFPTAAHAYNWLDAIKLDGQKWNELMDAWKARKTKGKAKGRATRGKG